MEYTDILKRKESHYGEKSEAVYEFAAEEFATRQMISENESILEMAKVHMDNRAIVVIEQRISELKKIIAH